MPEVTADFETLSFETLGKAVDKAAEAVSALPEGTSKEAALELKDAIEAAHKAALTTIVRKLKGDEAGKKLLFELVDDPLVRMLLALHGIIRTQPPEGTSQVGGAKGKPLPAGGHGHSHGEASGPALVPLNLVRRRHPEEDELEREGWTRTVAAKTVPQGEATPVRVQRADGSTEEVILVWARDELVAYENRCAHEAQPLSEALVDTMACTVMCPWHGYRYDSSTGECLTFGGLGLSKREVRVVGRDVWIKGGGQR